ncbi:energy transducer TonB [Fretibacter rubidus]|uniref:energy transducer TonB n=1 Tax=Fretibacter rubidus TaxID=570162 RepID=UPI003529EDF5
MKLSSVFITLLTAFLIAPASLAQAPDAQGNPTIMADRPATFKKGIPPKTPNSAKRSGYCCINVNIDIDGKVTDTRALTCSHKRFKRESLKRVGQYKYYPVIKDGVAVPSTIITSVPFIMVGSKGHVIPSADGEIDDSFLSPVTRKDICAADKVQAAN